jgi:hypothetical protein
METHFVRRNGGCGTKISLLFATASALKRGEQTERKHSITDITEVTENGDQDNKLPFEAVPRSSPSHLLEFDQTFVR